MERNHVPNFNLMLGISCIIRNQEKNPKEYSLFPFHSLCFVKTPIKKEEEEEEKVEV
jgi:hypothetical protein